MILGARATRRAGAERRGSLRRRGGGGRPTIILCALIAYLVGCSRGAPTKAPGLLARPRLALKEAPLLPRTPEELPRPRVGLVGPTGAI